MLTRPVHPCCCHALHFSPLAGGTAASTSLLLTSSAAASAQTMRIRQINHEAQRNDSVGERVGHWKAWFREKGEGLGAVWLAGVASVAGLSS